MVKVVISLPLPYVEVQYDGESAVLDKAAHDQASGQIAKQSLLPLIAELKASEDTSALQNIQRMNYISSFTPNDVFTLSLLSSSASASPHDGGGAHTPKPISGVHASASGDSPFASALLPETTWVENGSRNICVADGYGVLRVPDACDVVLYDGQWRRGMRHGAGRGAIFTRPSSNSKPSSRGAAGRDSESEPAQYEGEYDGQWCVGLRHGRGVMVEDGGVVRYEGGWRCDHRHGEGTETIGTSSMSSATSGAASSAYPTGGSAHAASAHASAGVSTYRGYWSRGKKHGCGVFTWPDGRLERREYVHGALIASRPLADATALGGSATGQAAAQMTPQQLYSPALGPAASPVAGGVSAMTRINSAYNMSALQHQVAAQMQQHHAQAVHHAHQLQRISSMGSTMTDYSASTAAAQGGIPMLASSASYASAATAAAGAGVSGGSAGAAGIGLEVPFPLSPPHGPASAAAGDALSAAHGAQYAQQQQYAPSGGSFMPPRTISSGPVSVTTPGFTFDVTAPGGSLSESSMILDAQQQQPAVTGPAAAALAMGLIGHGSVVPGLPRTASGLTLSAGAYGAGGGFGWGGLQPMGLQMGQIGMNLGNLTGMIGVGPHGLQVPVGVTASGKSVSLQLNADVLRLLKHTSVNDLPAGRDAVVTVEKRDTVETCLTKMSERNVLSVPVYDEVAGRFCAIVHILDVFAFMLELVAKKKATFSPQAGSGSGPGGSLRETLAHQKRFAYAPISEVLEMSRHMHPTAFRPLPAGTPLIYAAQILAEGAHAVPIVDTFDTSYTYTSTSVNTSRSYSMAEHTPAAGATTSSSGRLMSTGGGAASPAPPDSRRGSASSSPTLSPTVAPHATYAVPASMLTGAALQPSPQHSASFRKDRGMSTSSGTGSVGGYGSSALAAGVAGSAGVGPSTGAITSGISAPTLTLPHPLPSPSPTPSVASASSASSPAPNATPVAELPSHLPGGTLVLPHSSTAAAAQQQHQGHPAITVAAAVAGTPPAAAAAGATPTPSSSAASSFGAPQSPRPSPSTNTAASAAAAGAGGGRIIRMITQADIIRFVASHLDELGPLASMQVGELGLGFPVANTTDDQASGTAGGAGGAGVGQATAGGGATGSMGDGGASGSGAPGLVVARFSDRAFDVFQQMRQIGAPAAPVVDQYGAMAANLSLSDVKTIAKRANFGALSQPISGFFRSIEKGVEAMSPSIYVRASTPFSSLVLTLAATRIHQLYFVDERLHPVGCVRVSDVLKVLIDEGVAM